MAAGWTQDELVAGVLAGDRRALARAISLVEDRRPRRREELVRRSTRDTGRAASIGVTGPPGVGKSSLVSALVAPRPRRWAGASASSRSTPRARSPGARCSATVSGSPTTSSTPGSTSARWGRAGISAGSPRRRSRRSSSSTPPGKDVVFLETVGTGQSEVEVIGIADVVLLVLMPGSGDSVQALKAGIMEIPDVIAINKMDHPAAKTMLQEVRSIVALDPDARAAAARSSSPRRFAARACPSSGRRSSSARQRARGARRARRSPPAEPERARSRRSPSRGSGQLVRRTMARRPGAAGARRGRAAARGRSPHRGQRLVVERSWRAARRERPRRRSTTFAQRRSGSTASPA